MRYRRGALGAVVGLALAAGMAAPALAAPARGTWAGPAVKAVSAWKDDPVVSQFIKSVGAAAIRNQTALGTFRSWIIRQPGFARSGWVGSIDNLARKAMTVMWSGPRTPLLTAIIAQGEQRGITVTIQHREHSLQQLKAAIAAIERQAAQGRWAGFRISAIAAISARRDGLTVEGTYTAVPAARRAPQVRSLATVVRGVPVRVAPGNPVALTAGRDADFAPFNAGGLMASFYSSPICSSGFSIVINGTTHTVTARHCVSTHNGVYDFVDANDSLALNPPPTDQWYGNSIGTSGDGAARIMSQSGSALMFNHAWNSTTTSTVIGYQDLGINDLVCTEGGNSGEHCNVKVTNMLVEITDPFGSFATIEGDQTSGTIAAMHGDSGGPVMSLNNTSSGQVRAAGMIQAGGGNSLSNCGASWSPNPCYKTVYFTSMRTIVDSISGASLVTG